MLLKRVNQLFLIIAKNDLLNWIPSNLYLRLYYLLRMKKHLRLRNPVTFNEKLQWLKLHNRQPEYTKMVDKLVVRDYVSSVIGDRYLVPLLGVWDSPAMIDFDSLPNKFVLKCNHDQGSTKIIDKSSLKKNEIIDFYKQRLRRNPYSSTREWPYKNVPRKIIAEEYMVDESGTELKDYKFNCFNGEPVFVQVMSGRSKGKYCLDHFGLEWQQMDIRRKNHLPSDVPIQRPEHLDEMIQIARILSKDIPYVRIDLYQAQGRVFFGEITFFPVSGYVDYVDYQTDLELGRMIQLPNIKKDA